MRQLKPGKTGELLDGDDEVLRLGLEQSSYKEIGANQFALSSAERKEEWKRISVWETSLTSIDQAKELLSNPKRRLAIVFNVDDIRSITLDDQVALDVKWDRLAECLDDNGNLVPGAKAGCKGHCAIDGIYSQGKKLRKKVRKRLAMLAMESEWKVLER